MRRHWLPAVPVRGGRRAATARRCARGCSARTWWCSATRKAASACSTSAARTAAPRSPSAATRSAACAASTTAGSSTWRATSGDVLRARAAAPCCKAIRQKAYPAREGGGFVWVWMGAKEQMREFEPPAWAPRARASMAIVKMHAACNWAQVLEGSIDSAHSSSLHSTDMPAARASTAPRRRRPAGRAPRTTRRRACSSSRRATASATPRSASRSAIPTPISTCARRSSSRRSRC